MAGDVRAAVPLALLAALLLVTAPASAAPTTLDLDAGTLAVITVAPDACGSDATEVEGLEAGDDAALCLRFDPSGGNASVNVTVTVAPPADLDFAGTNATFAVEANATTTGFASLAFTVDANTTASSFDLPVTVTVTGPNGTVLETAETTHPVGLGAEAPPGDDDGPPSTLLLLVLAVLLVGLGAGGVVALRRRRQVRAQPRSQALRQMEAQRTLERAKRPEERQRVEAAIQAAEAERSLTREAQVLQAKIDDTRNGLERLQERFEAGQLTQHQYDRMRQRREEQLEALMRELDGMSGR